MAAQENNIPWENGVFCILDTKGKMAGAGFLVAEKLAVTCAHVVEAAGSGPGAAISVRFYNRTETCQATVLADPWRPPAEQDVAVLEFTGSLPGGVRPLPVSSDKEHAKHSFRSLGYPQVGAYSFLRAAGEIIGRVSKDNTERLQISSTQLTQGFSGAPVWDEDCQQTVGMAVEIMRPDANGKNLDTAFGIPGDILIHICPEIPSPLLTYKC